MGKTVGHLLLGASMIGLAATGVGHAATPEEAAAPDPAAEAGGETLIVTGARSAGRTVENSPTPIDVLSADTLREANQSSLLQTLNDTLPSFNVPNLPSYGINTFIRAGQLRGLSSGHVLVLVNGRRRHVTARLGVNDAGAAAVDLGLIPISTIDRVEVLRDGASALYGSDAIAGVINVVTRKDNEGGTLSARVGEYYQGGGTAQQYDAGLGLKLPNEGHLYLSGQYIQQKALFGDGEVPSQYLFYFPRDAAGNPILPGGNRSTGPTLPAGATPDPREATVDRRKIFGASGGVPRAKVATFTADFALPFGNGIELYGFGDYSHRTGRSPQHFRFPSRDEVVRAIWPDGFTPYSGVKENNFSVQAGLRGEIGGWNWDLSSVFGRDDIDTYVYDSNSPSYGLASKTDFFLGNYRYSAWTNNLDLRRTDEEGLFGVTTDWSFGAEYRRETYRRTAGEEQSWNHGGQPILDGPRAGQPIPRSESGSQADVGVRPQDAARGSRNVYAVYAGLSLRPSDAVTVDLAARYEDYEDSGGTLTGRASGRYEFAPGFALRGTASTGFQAPALAAQSFSQTNVTVNTTNHTLSVSSPEAQALGARLLDPEKSLNFSAGIVASPAPNVNLAVDLYQIRVKDRISSVATFSELTNPGSGALVQAASPLFGPNDGISYLINAGTTRTRGVDVVLDGSFDLDTAGKLRWSLAGNYNSTDYLKVAPTPAVLSRFNIVLVSAATQVQARYRAPVYKGIASLNWSSGPYSLGLRGTYYGKLNRAYTVTVPGGPNEMVIRDVGQVFIADLEAGYDFTERLGLRVNVSNLFDRKPPQVPLNATSRWPFASKAYVQDSPVNPLGGFYSATITYRW